MTKKEKVFNYIYENYKGYSYKVLLSCKLYELEEIIIYEMHQSVDEVYATLGIKIK